MTKQELLNEIESNVEWMGTPESVTAPAGISQYDVPVRYLTQNGTSQIATQPIIVEDEGGAGESAYYARQQIQNWQEDLFVTNLNTAIADYEANNVNVLKVVVEEVNREKNFAIVTVYQNDGSGSIETVQRFVNGNPDETIENHYPYIG